MSAPDQPGRLESFDVHRNWIAQRHDEVFRLVQVITSLSWPHSNSRKRLCNTKYFITLWTHKLLFYYLSWLAYKGERITCLLLKAAIIPQGHISLPKQGRSKSLLNVYRGESPEIGLFPIAVELLVLGWKECFCAFSIKLRWRSFFSYLQVCGGSYTIYLIPWHAAAKAPINLLGLYLATFT